MTELLSQVKKDTIQDPKEITQSVELLNVAEVLNLAERLNMVAVGHKLVEMEEPVHLNMV